MWPQAQDKLRPMRLPKPLALQLHTPGRHLSPNTALQDSHHKWDPHEHPGIDQGHHQDKQMAPHTCTCPAETPDWPGSPFPLLGSQTGRWMTGFDRSTFAKCCLQDRWGLLSIPHTWHWNLQWSLQDKYNPPKTKHPGLRWYEMHGMECMLSVLARADIHSHHMLNTPCCHSCHWCSPWGMAHIWWKMCWAGCTLAGIACIEKSFQHHPTLPPTQSRQDKGHSSQHLSGWQQNSPAHQPYRSLGRSWFPLASIWPIFLRCFESTRKQRYGRWHSAPSAQEGGLALQPAQRWSWPQIFELCWPGFSNHVALSC